jgi:ATP-dependent Clp protease ATP-binding subunit ClpA
MSKQPKNDPLLAAINGLKAIGATDLTEQAERGRLPRAHGRDREVEQVIAALRERQHVLLLGPSGVGKTAVRNEVINRIVRGQAHEELRGWRFVELSTTAIEAGSMNAGQWAARLSMVVQILTSARRIGLYLSNIWHLRDAGRYSGQTESFATYLRPHLEQRAFPLLGESTPENFAGASTHGGWYAFALASDPALVGLFALVRIEEPDAEATRAILRAAASDLERAHGVEIDRPALERALELTRRFQPYQAFPGKAVQLLAEVARARRPAGAALAAGTAVRLGVEAVMAGFGRVSGLPEKVFSDAVPLPQDEIRRYFAERVVGQDEAVEAVVDLVTLVKAELTDPGRPLGVLLFVGPTGTGKTFLAKTLAEYLFGSPERMIRFDMSEYKTPESLPQLARLLVEKVRQQSFSVLLLDEIEKAAWPIFDLFLQAFDDGRVTDPHGRTADLRNTIVVMTSNLGSELGAPRSLGFFAADRARTPDRQAELLKVVEEYFRPEFINRLDKIVAFRRLGPDEVRRIARRELGRALMREGVIRRNILLDFRDEVLDVLVAAGFSERYGARPLQRAIKERVLLPLARRIAAEPAAGDELLELCARDGEIAFEPIPLGPSEPPDGGAPHPLLALEDEAETDERPRRAMDLAELAGATVALRERVAAQTDGPRFRALQAEAERLLAEVGRPSFWDDPERARATLAAVYQHERLTDLFADLRRRADELAEIPALLRRHRDQAGVPRLERRYRELLKQVEMAELELLAGETGRPTTGALVALSPIALPRSSGAAGWARTLEGMYAAWARARGLEAESIAEADGGERLLLVRGPGVAAILRGEDGVHRRQTGPPGERTRVELVRVEIVPLLASPPRPAPEAVAEGELQIVAIAPSRIGREAEDVVEVATTDGRTLRVRGRGAEEAALALLAERARPARPEDEASDLVRVYHIGRSHYVRDPRTGERSNRPRDVLAGAIDAFLLAYLRQNAGPL